MPIAVVTIDNVMDHGIRAAGFAPCTGSLAQDRFKLTYGVLPETVHQLYGDIQDEALVDRFVIKKTNLSDLLMTLHWMKTYCREVDLAGLFSISEKTARGRIWMYATSIAALKEAKIVWPFDTVNDIESEFIISVDGTHCRINEPRDEPSAMWYSHKFHHSALNYEIGVHLYESKVVWINGPFPAGSHDITIYRKALKNKIPETKKIIADKGYQSKHETNISTPNPFDCAEVKKFKGRARARHETFNRRIKIFDILSGTFRHNIEKHKCIFEAVCVLVQYDMQNGQPLFDI